MAPQTPRGREKHVTDNAKNVYRRGEGLGTGPVGNRKTSSSQGTPGIPGEGGRFNGNRSSSSRSTQTRSSGGSPLIAIIALVVLLLGGGGGALSGLFGGGDSSSSGSYTQSYESYATAAPAASQSQSSSGSSSGYSTSSALFSALMGGQGTSSYTSGSSWSNTANTGKLNTKVAAGSRDKYTQILGSGEDTTTIMVYLCGTDLESKSAMASRDLQEMASATFDDHINLIVYTGGCTGWQISGISTETNQIYQIKDGKMRRLESNMGSKSMTDPATLTEFIQYCGKNFPANRYDLIFWDHGGGSISGYGYDQKFPSSGSMNLSSISKALKAGKLKYDFIGFDACLMATAENALMLGDYADYLIASEETEPGIGWYYTNWLTAYGKNPSMDTLSLGKQIVDDFVSACAQSCAGQQTTLSVIDLAEFANTVPDALTDFATDTSERISNQEYTEVATARQSTREFAQSSRIDQCDLVDLALRLDTDASRKLADTLLSAVKYNKTSSNMTNAYGVSVYFPNRKPANAEKAATIDDAIGMDDTFGDCIRAYASMQTAGQTVATGSGNTGSPYASLFGSSSGSGYSASGTASQEMATQLLYALFGGTSGTSSASGRSLSEDDAAAFIADHQFDASKLVWQEDSNGGCSITLPTEQWELVTGLDQNMFYDDGSGYIDFGCDNLFSLDDNGTLIADTDRTWLAINGQPVAYYHLTTVDDGTNYSITGYVPAMLNGERVKLYLVFDNDHPYGFISGYATDYHNGETDTIAKADSELAEGDTLDFLCDYYSYDGTYQDSYYLGDRMTVTADMEISNVSIPAQSALVTYKFTDIYGQEYWTPVLP